ncbi:MAG TPA: amidohydrolase family protein [Thermoanaerobaculia bacterium]|nr:amidohydrolase family protein [Thermoanaerobaculia bacterium]
MRPRSAFVVALLVALGFGSLVLSQPATTPSRTLVHAGRLIDGESAQARSKVTVVIEKGRISAVENGFSRPGAGDRVIDLSDHTVLPGLIDLHVHLGTEPSPQAYLERFTWNPADVALRGAAHARATLEAGFTTVRNLGDGDNVTVSLREAIRKGWIPGPRIFTAGKSIATTGGHADPTNGWAEGIQVDPGPREGVVNGADDARKAVRQRYKDGADLIKITATGGVLSLAKSPDAPQFREDEVRAIVETARDYGFTVAAHAHGTEGMKRAIRAGVDSIEHGTRADDEVFRLMREHGTTLVPTLSAGRYVGEKSKIEGFYPEVVRPKAAAIGAEVSAMFRRAVAAGVKIAFGTDAGVFPHGENAKEFLYLVEGGMTPMAAIQAATREAARLLRQEDSLGTVAPGKVADLVATRRDPLADVSALTEIDFVMKDGVVYKAP